MFRLMDLTSGRHDNVGAVTDREIDSFEERHPDAYATFALAMKEYSKYVNEEAAQDGEAAAAPSAAARRKPRITLEHSPLGFPIIPHPQATPEEEDGAEYQKRVLRSFLTEHYSEILAAISCCITKLTHLLPKRIGLW